MNEKKPVLKFNVAWSVLLAGALGASAPAGAQQLIAWPMGQPSPLRLLLPGQPVRPLPVHPWPLPHPDPGPRPLPELPPDAAPVALSGYQVEGTIDDQVANLTYHVTFHNPTNRRLEGVLVFPIPADTVLSGFSMMVGDKKMSSELLEAGQAGTIYENIVRQLRDPAILELVGERLVRARVFPIEPGGDVSVRMSVSQILHKSGELTSLTVPLKSAKILGSAGRASVKIALNASSPIRTLYSPSGATVRRIDERRAEVSYEGGSGEAADLNLFYSLRADPLAAGLLTFKEEGEDGYFLLSLSPRPKVDETAATPKDIVFIVDRSGSMQDDGKIEQARGALRYCLKRLSPNDRFGIVDFATDSNVFDARLSPATPENKARALRYVDRIEAAGGTNIEAALADGMKLLKPAPERVPMVFFLTDGVPTVGNTDVQALLKRAAEANASLRARVFSFGVGSDVNTLFLDKLAEMNRGSRDYAAPGEDIENKVSTLYQKVAKPALTDVSLEWSGVSAVEVYPRPITDLFYGSELVVLGRYHGHGSGSLAVTGRAGSRPQRFVFPVEFGAAASRNAFLPRLWANLKVSHELDALRLSGSGSADPEVVKEIVTLAKRYGIVTPFTSYLITEEGANLGRAQEAARQSIGVMAADAAASGFSGGAKRAMAAQKSSAFFNRLGALAPAAASGMLSGAASFEPMHDAEAEARRELKADGRQAAELRSIGGKTFYRRGATWVDGDYELLAEKPEPRAIGYLSAEYFDLLARHPDLGRYLSLGPDMTVVYQGIAYRIAPEAAPAD